jgi:polyphenol oxidase
MFYSTKLKKIKSIQHCFFSRKNGYSSGLYESLNCGFGSNDKVDNILKNLEFVSKQFNIEKKNLKLMNQTHSNKVIFVDSSNKNKEKFNSDALVTKEKNLVLGVLTADCVPIILYDIKNKIIGVIHAGWKGSLSGIIANTIKVFSKINSDNNIHACVGPCIGKKSYEVEKEFLGKFIEESKNNVYFFDKINKTKFNFNLRGYIHKKLNESGVKIVDNIDFDTFEDKDNFFSYRRSTLLGEKDYGRCISAISLGSV